MKRMTPEQLIEQALYSLNKKVGNDDVDLRTIAFAVYAATNGAIENLPDKYGFTDFDINEYLESVDPRIPSTENASYINEPSAPIVNTRESRPVQQFDSQAQGPRRSNLIIPRDVNKLRNQPLVPEQRVNEWYDDGSIESGLRQVDKSILKPQYQHGRRAPEGRYLDLRCRGCRQEFSVDESEYREFNGKDQLYEFGYICASCAKKEVIGGNR